MKSNEVRVGNYVLFSGVETKVIPPDFATQCRGRNGSEMPNFKPIELTEEWLLKAGFKSDDYKPGYIGIDVHNENGMSTDFVLSYPGRMGEWQKYFAWEFNNYMFNKIEFVHELQNFYAAMTGYELSFSTEP